MFGRETYGESNDGTLMVLIGDKRFTKFGITTTRILVAIRDGKTVKVDGGVNSAALALLGAYKLIQHTDQIADDYEITDAGREALERIANSTDS